MLKSLMNPASDHLRQVSEPLKPRLAETLHIPCPGYDPARVHHVGVFLGEGVGPEVVPIAVSLLETLSGASSRRFEIHEGGLIGLPAKELYGSSLSPEVTEFASDIFDRGGALFCGPGGDRFVYEVRRQCLRA